MAGALTGMVVIGETSASVLPSGMTTVRGISTCARSLATEITAPPAGAGPFNLTRACVECPPETPLGCGSMSIRLSPGGVGGDATTRNGTPEDHGPDTSPCLARTRQK